MKLLKNILVAADFDDTSEPLLAGARTLAKQFDSNVILMHAIESAERTGQPVERLEAAITARLEEWRDQLRAAGIAVPQILCRHGKAFVEIGTAAERLDANLIMLGSRGVATDHHFPLGTTTEKVIRRSPKPVLAVQPDKPLGFANILCPVDFSDASARGLTNAIRLARAFRGKLHVLTVVPTLTWLTTLAEAGHLSEAAVVHQREWRAEFDQFLSMGGLGDITWHKEVRSGAPHDEIVASAKANAADLIVMGSTAEFARSRKARSQNTNWAWWTDTNPMRQRGPSICLANASGWFGTNQFRSGQVLLLWRTAKDGGELVDLRSVQDG